MAQDDMYVVMYKILSYLYTCMKKGIEPDISSINAEALGINESYWQNIVGQLYDHYYIDGVVKLYAWDVWGGTLFKFVNPTVTMEGVAFLYENAFI